MNPITVLRRRKLQALGALLLLGLLLAATAIRWQPSTQAASGPVNKVAVSGPRAPQAVGVSASKDDSLVTDNNSNSKADPGDTLRYSVTINNFGTTDATSLQFDDTPDSNTTLVAGSLAASAVANNDTY